jgi:hypothetical protein
VFLLPLYYQQLHGETVLDADWFTAGPDELAAHSTPSRMKRLLATVHADGIA